MTARAVPTTVGAARAAVRWSTAIGSGGGTGR